ncbi:MAG: 3-deoxy-D-manno-octulosonic acid kinase [Gammaproteobacteria bacterium]|nr:3-deoxy-D-manno-octulosonic acid kinase [Gammaproteobacteria bacterium]MDH5736069.1 3-deoxy-D-manno-octulosonic acid kinase [Gammaproteobacteria bacterium]
MTSAIITGIKQDNHCYILYDEAAINMPGAQLFNPGWLKHHGDVTQIGRGRGSAWFVNYNHHQWVLRHYRRGGFVSRFINDTYWCPTLNSSRSWHEWNLLKELYNSGLPVPKPVAACINRAFGFYQADIIIEKIPDTQTLAEILEQRQLPHDQWKKIASTIKQFHDHGVYHADLNANNILLDKNNEIFIIDFDRGQIKKHGSWKETNLARLKRSLVKLRNCKTLFLYQDEDWEALQNAYYKK